MALYRMEAKIIARENRGRSVVAASAYRSGGKIKDERCDKTRDYTRRSKGVIETAILRPAGAPEWAADPGQLWNFVERGEKRKDAQLAREFVLAVPPELDAKQQWGLAVGWAQSELVDKGMVAELSLHHPKDGKNPHVHVLCTMRRFDGDQFGKKVREWNDVNVLLGWRKSWAQRPGDRPHPRIQDRRCGHGHASPGVRHATPPGSAAGEVAQLRPAMASCD